MRGKVSMVMPCYNKKDYIGEMLDSVIAQEWDNIELILVNDGSTDGTREVIENYVQRIRARGYELLIIDQENAGVCAAAKAGLERVTGDYVCMIDSDDELDPKYVSTMAGWLEENPEYDYAVCGSLIYSGFGENRQVRPDALFQPLENEWPRLLEIYLLARMRATVWVYLLRSDYLRRCKIVENYYTDTKGSHEPGYIVPLLAHGGKRKNFSLPLYRYNIVLDGHSQFKQYLRAKEFFDDYIILSHKAIDVLPEHIADDDKKRRLKQISTLSRLTRLCRCAKTMRDGDGFLDQISTELASFVNERFSPSPMIEKEQMMGVEVELMQIIENAVLGRKGESVEFPVGKNVVAYGVLGKNGRETLPLLMDTPIAPRTLWDRAAGEGTGMCGLKVIKPDFYGLSEDDIVLIFPSREPVPTEVKRELASTRCDKYMELEQIRRCVLLWRFPGFINGDFTFRA